MADDRGQERSPSNKSSGPADVDALREQESPEPSQRLCTSDVEAPHAVPLRKAEERPERTSRIDGLPPLASPCLKELTTRFLYPFFFNRRAVEDALADLSSLTLCGRTDVWRRAQAPETYKDEVHRHVAEYLFPDKDGGGKCAYLKVSDGILNTLFQHAEVQWGKKQAIKIAPVWEVGIELFFAPFGVGVLSLAFRPTASTLDTAVATDFNYRLAQLRRKGGAHLRIPHPSEQAESWNRLPEAVRQTIAPPPAPEAPLAQRLGVRGGCFTMTELITELLSPLAHLGFEEIQSQLSVYCVARFGTEMDLEDLGVRRQAWPFVAALAQIEEPDHAGALLDNPGLAHAILNRRHWAAVGLYGAAHLLADQPPPRGAAEHPFNEQRVPRVRDKYFTPYVLSMLQRFFLHRTIDEAGMAVRQPTATRDKLLASLRADLLTFSVGGHFTLVSNRHVLHSFYQLAREGMDVPRAWDEVRRVISDLDGSSSAERQERIASDIARNLRVVARTQSMVEWIEIFLVSVYAAHLWEIVSADLVREPHRWLVSLGALACAVLGGVATAIILKPWKHVVKNHD